MAYKIPTKLKKEIQEEKMERRKVIRVYAQNYHYPISDIKNFNNLLEKQTGYTTNQGELKKLLKY
jgi:hypothetical protein